MEFRDLKAQYKALKKDIDIAMLKVASDGNYIMGEQVAELERQLAEYVGVKHCITCANGTDALTLLLMAWDIKKGDAIFIPNFTFFATGEVVSYEGATPIFVDVYEDTFNIDTNKLEEAIIKTKKEGILNPKAIIAVDLFGLPADYEEIQKISNKYDLLVFEDAAQGFGGKIGNRKACSFGDAATTSFFPAKPLGCYGDGGAIFTNYDDKAELIKSLRVHGKGSHKYDNVRIGINSRLDTIQAAILIEKFKAFIDYELESVNKVAGTYNKHLKEIVETPTFSSDYYSSWAQYTIKLKDKYQRDGLMNYLKVNNIPSMIYYPKPMSYQKAFDQLNINQCNLEVTSALCDRVLSLPMHPYLSVSEIKEVVSIIKEYLEIN